MQMWNLEHCIYGFEKAFLCVKSLVARSNSNSNKSQIKFSPPEPQEILNVRKLKKFYPSK